MQSWQSCAGGRCKNILEKYSGDFNKQPVMNINRAGKGLQLQRNTLFIILD
jgi:hypothetical protein